MKMMVIRTTHYLVHAAHEVHSEFMVYVFTSSCRFLILVVSYYQVCLEQLIGVDCSLFVSMWFSVVLLVL